jgi:hypothetical protein
MPATPTSSASRSTAPPANNHAAATKVTPGVAPGRAVKTPWSIRPNAKPWTST